MWADFDRADYHSVRLASLRSRHSGFRRTPNPGSSESFNRPFCGTGSLSRRGENIGMILSAPGAIIRNSENGLL